MLSGDDAVTAIIDIRFSHERGITIRLGEVRILKELKDPGAGYFLQVVFGSTSLFFLSSEIKHGRIISFKQIFTGPNLSGPDVPVTISLFHNALAVRNNSETATLIGRLEANLDDLIGIAGDRPMDKEFWLLLYHQISTVTPPLCHMDLEPESMIEKITNRPEPIRAVQSTDHFGEFNSRQAIANEHQSLPDIAKYRQFMHTPWSNGCPGFLTRLVMSRSYSSDTRLCTSNAPIEFVEIFPRPNQSSLLSHSISQEVSTECRQSRPFNSSTSIAPDDRTSLLDEHFEPGPSPFASNRSNRLPPASCNSTTPRPDVVSKPTETRPRKAYPSDARRPAVDKTRGLPHYQSCGKCAINGRWFNRYRVALKRDENMTEVGFELSGGRPPTIISVKAQSEAGARGLKVGDIILGIEDWDLLGMDSQTILREIRNSRNSLWLEFGRPADKITFFGMIQNIRSILSCRPRTKRGNPGNPPIDKPCPCPEPRTPRAEEERQSRGFFKSLGLRNRIKGFRKKKPDNNYSVSKATKKFTSDNSAGIASSETARNLPHYVHRRVTPACHEWQTSHAQNSFTRRGLGTVRLMPLPEPPIVNKHRNKLGLNATYDNIDDMPDAELDSDDYDDTIVSDKIDNEALRKSAVSESRNVKTAAYRTTTDGTARAASVPDDSYVHAGDQAAADTSGYVTSSRDSELHAAGESKLLTNFPPSSSRRTRKRKRPSKAVALRDDDDDDDKENVATEEATFIVGSSDSLDEANVARFFSDASFDSNVAESQESERNSHVKFRKAANQTFVVSRAKNPSSSGGRNIPSSSFANGFIASKSPSQSFKSAVLAEVSANTEFSDNSQQNSQSLVVSRKRHTTCGNHNPRTSQRTHINQTAVIRQRTDISQRINSKPKKNVNNNSKNVSKSDESPATSDITSTLRLLVQSLTSTLQELEHEFRDQVTSMITQLREFIYEQGLYDNFQAFLAIITKIEDANLKHCQMIRDWETNPPQPEQLVEFSIKLLEAYKDVCQAYFEKLGVNMRRFKILIYFRDRAILSSEGRHYRRRRATLSSVGLEEILKRPAKHLTKILTAISNFTEPVELPGISDLSNILSECWKLLTRSIKEMPTIRVPKSMLRNCQKRNLGEL